MANWEYFKLQIEDDFIHKIIKKNNKRQIVLMFLQCRNCKFHTDETIIQIQIVHLQFQTFETANFAFGTSNFAYKKKWQNSEVFLPIVAIFGKFFHFQNSKSTLANKTWQNCKELKAFLQIVAVFWPILQPMAIKSWKYENFLRIVAVFGKFFDFCNKKSTLVNETKPNFKKLKEFLQIVAVFGRCFNRWQ